MKIAKVCDICGSATREGDYGESWWICSNRDCRKNNPNWSFNDSFAPYREEWNKLNSKINELSNVEVDGYNIEVETDEFRWIGEGSGNIRIKSSNHETDIRFYLKKDKVEYSTSDSIILNVLGSIDFDLKVKEIWELTRNRNYIFSMKNK